MQIAQILAGYSLGEADLLRRAMGKKKKEEMDQQQARFLSGAAEQGRAAPSRPSAIFELVAKFAGYGFNKSHAAPYALIAYQTAWLKANAPVEFFAASMSLDISNTDKLAVFYQDAKRIGRADPPPDVNRSGADFEVEDGEVLYALGAVRNVGLQAMEHLVAVREAGGRFRDLFDFARAGRSATGQQAGAGEPGPGRRLRHHPPATAPRSSPRPTSLIAYAQSVAAERASAQASLFGEQAEAARPRLPTRRAAGSGPSSWTRNWRRSASI